MKQHHPNIGDTQIVHWINEAQQEVADRIGRVTEKDGTFSTDGTNIYFEFSDISGVTDSDDLLEIDRVDYDGKMIQFVRNPEKIEGY